LKIETPILQAPMAGVQDSKMAIAVSEAGGLGALPCAMLSADKVKSEIETIRRGTSKSFNVNFFCHPTPTLDDAAELRWRKALEPYYREFGLDPSSISNEALRASFDEEFCAIVENHKPSVVSFHFGLPKADLLERVKATGTKILSSATTVAEAIWLEQQGCDAVIAQGSEAGGHRAMFLSNDVATQTDLFELLPQIVAAIKIPVIASGGIADAKNMKTAFDLGAAAVQIGTAYLYCPEATISPLYRQALTSENETTITNLFSGRPARGIVNRFVREMGPLSPLAPPFPLASRAVAPLRRESEKRNMIDFMQLWAGKYASASQHTYSAFDFTRFLAKEALQAIGH
jgi:nitronate monooxygenase